MKARQSYGEETMTNFERVYVEDLLLAEVMRHSPYSPLDTAIAYQELRSFDRLLDCIGQATREKRPLSQVVKGRMNHGCE